MAQRKYPTHKNMQVPKKAFRPKEDQAQSTVWNNGNHDAANIIKKIAPTNKSNKNCTFVRNYKKKYYLCGAKQGEVVKAAVGFKSRIVHGFRVPLRVPLKPLPAGDLSSAFLFNGV